MGLFNPQHPRPQMVPNDAQLTSMPPPMVPNAQMPRMPLMAPNAPMGPVPPMVANALICQQSAQMGPIRPIVPNAVMGQQNAQMGPIPPMSLSALMGQPNTQIGSVPLVTANALMCQQNAHMGRITPMAPNAVMGQQNAQMGPTPLMPLNALMGQPNTQMGPIPPMVPNAQMNQSNVQMGPILSQNLNPLSALQQLLGPASSMQQSMPQLNDQLQNIAFLAALGSQVLASNLPQNLNHFPALPNGYVGSNSPMLSHSMHQLTNDSGIPQSSQPGGVPMREHISGFIGNPHRALDKFRPSFGGKASSNGSNHAMGQSGKNEPPVVPHGNQSPFPPHGQLQNLNFLPALQSGGRQVLPSNILQNANQLPALPCGQMGPNNPMLSQGINQLANGLCSLQSSPLGGLPMSKHKSGIVSSPHMALDKSRAGFDGKTSSDGKNHVLGQTKNESPISVNGNQSLFSPHSKNESPIYVNGNQSPFSPRSSQNQPNVFNKVNHSEGGAVGTSKVKSGNFGKSFIRQGATHMRYQKSRFNPTGRRGHSMPFAKPHGRGGGNYRGGKSDPANCSGPAYAQQQRRAPIIYDQQEVQQWREARKRNFPTSTNIKKKLASSGTNAENTDDSKLRRQQLKEVISQQTEMGYEAPELPPGYLSGSENGVNPMRHNNKIIYKTEKTPRRLGHKRGIHGRKDFRAKRLKRGDDASVASDALLAKAREPTLLQKLLSAEIRKDKYRLLQAFRFMASNSFFAGWSEEPMNFPPVLVKQAGSVVELGYPNGEGQRCLEAGHDQRR